MATDVFQNFAQAGGVIVLSQFLGMQARFKEGRNLSLTHTHINFAVIYVHKNT